MAADDEVFVVATYLSGTLRQRRTGVGWRSLSDLPAPAAGPSLTVLEVDAAFETLAAVAGAGSQAERRRLLDALFGRDGRRAGLLRGLVTGEVRRARSTACSSTPSRPRPRSRDRSCAARRCWPAPRRRRPPRLTAAPPRWTSSACRRAARCGRCWPAGARRRRGVAVTGRRASSTPSSTASGSRCTSTATRSSVFTRSLDEITARLPEVVAAARIAAGHRPGPRRRGDRPRRDRPAAAVPGDRVHDRRRKAGATGIQPFFFDLLLHEGDS